LKISNETKVGILAAFALAIFIMGYNYLMGNDMFARQTFYYAKYSRVDGLKPSDPVQVNGFRVGRVTGIDLTKDGSGRLIVKIGITHELDIPEDSEAKIASLDLLGQKAVQLTLGESAQLAQNGDTLYSAVQEELGDEVRKEILPVKQKAEDLMSSLDSVITIIKTIIQDIQLDKSLASAESALNTFSVAATRLDTLIVNASGDIESILHNMDVFTNNLAKNNDQITNVLGNLEQITDSLAAASLTQTIINLESALGRLDSVLAQVNAGKGTVGMLVQDEKLYENLEGKPAGRPRKQPRQVCQFLTHQVRWPRPQKPG